MRYHWELNTIFLSMIYQQHTRQVPVHPLQVAAVDYETPRIQNELGDYRFTRNTALAIPFGIGWKAKLYGKLAFAAEISFRYRSLINWTIRPKNLLN